MADLFVKTIQEGESLGADYRRLIDVCNEHGVLQQMHSLEFLMHSDLFGGSAGPEAGGHSYEPVGSINSQRYVFPIDRRGRTLDEFNSSESEGLPGHKVKFKTAKYGGIGCESWIKLDYVTGIAIIVTGERIPKEVARVIQELEQVKISSKESQRPF